MNLRDRLYRIGLRYLDAYLPESHPILRDLRSRRRLRIVMGVGTVFDLILLSKLPVVIQAGGTRLLLFVILLAVFCAGLAWILLTGARALNFVIASFVSIGILHNVIDAYAYPFFPPRNLPFLYMIILSVHLLFGRWYSLFVLVIVAIAYVPLIHAPTIEGMTVIDPRIMDYRTNVMTNTIISGLMVWLISEAYDYFREASERQLLFLNREREKDLELAARVQKDLIPQLSRYGHYSIAAVSRPAAAIGGDYHEALRCGSINWFAIGDVSGHGLQAGMLSMQVRSMFAYLIMELGYDKPGDILVELNNSFHQIVKKLNIRSYMTFLLARIDDDGRLMFTGSHQKMVLIRARDGSVEVIPSHGIWLGLEHLENSGRIMEFEMQMEENDILFLFTDGLIEGRNESGESFGFERLLAFLQHDRAKNGELTEEQLTAHIVEAYDEFRGATPPDDDMTLFSIRRVTEKEA